MTETVRFDAETLKIKIIKTTRNTWRRCAAPLSVNLSLWISAYAIALMLLPVDSSSLLSPARRNTFIIPRHLS